MRIVFACNLFLVKYEITTNNQLLIIRTEHRREYQSRPMHVYLASQILCNILGTYVSFI